MQTLEWLMGVCTTMKVIAGPFSQGADFFSNLVLKELLVNIWLRSIFRGT